MSNCYSMLIHRRIGLLFLSFAAFLSSYAQEMSAIDSLKTSLQKASTPAEKVYWYDNLSRTMMNVNPRASDSIGQQLILFAEENRDRSLMVKAYMSNGLRCSYFRGQRNYTQRSIEYYEKALSIAKENKMEKDIGAAQLQLAEINLIVPDKDKARK